MHGADFQNNVDTLYLFIKTPKFRVSIKNFLMLSLEKMKQNHEGKMNKSKELNKR